jgi:hypothetical protein
VYYKFRGKTPNLYIHTAQTNGIVNTTSVAISIVSGIKDMAKKEAHPLPTYDKQEYFAPESPTALAQSFLH